MKKEYDKNVEECIREFMDIVEHLEKPYVFPYEDYQIIGETTNIDRIINTIGFVNLSVDDVARTLSKGTVNYVTDGLADGEGCIANALNVAIGKLPIWIEGISKLLFNIEMPKKSQSPMTEMQSFFHFVEQMPSDIDICWGCAYDESLEGQQIRVTLIAASK